MGSIDAKVTKIYIVRDTCYNINAFTTIDEIRAFRFAVEHSLGHHTNVVESTYVTILTPDVIRTEKSEVVDLQSASEIRKTALKYKFVDLLPEIEEQVKERNAFLDCFRKRKNIRDAS